MKRDFKIIYKTTLPVLTLIAILTFSLTYCSGGGGGGTGGTSAGQYTLSGTAASGRPLAGMVITLKDASGHSSTATTAQDGAYSIDTTGLTPPFLVQVAAGSTGTKYYSVSADTAATTTINITPLTDLIIRSWYGVQGVSMDTAFGDPTSHPAPSPAAVAIIGNAVQNVAQLWLNQAGVTSSNFSLISTPFSANGTGVDLVLDQASVNQATGSILITDGTTTQTSTLTASNGSVTVSTTTTGANGTSSSTNSTVVPVQTPQQAALAAITTSLNSFASTINTKGASLQLSDILPYLDPGLLNDGLNATQFGTDAVAEFKGETLSFNVLTIKSLDTTNNVADVVFSVSRSQGAETQTETTEFNFKNAGGSWLLSGNGKIASVNLAAEMRTTEGAIGGCTNCTGPDINVDVQAPIVGSVSTVTGGTLSGGILSGATLTTTSTTFDAPNNLFLNHYFYNTGALQTNQLPAVGTLFTLTLATPSGPVDYTLSTNAWTTEAISITAPTSGSMTDIPFNTPITVTWTLPKTFAITRVKLSAESFTGANNTGIDCNTNGPVLGITATTGAITIPATCGGQPVLDVNLNVDIEGVNGERETIIGQFK